MEHHIEKCKHCGTVIKQCRCPNFSKTIRYSVCAKCAKKGKPQDSRKEAARMNKRIWHKPHPDAEGVDEIRMKVVPRFKTSDMSGDEWRVSTLVEIFRKGVKVYETSFSRLRDAAQFLPWVLNVDVIEGPNAPKGGLFRADPDECHQAGCSEKSVNTYRLKKEYSSRGEGPLPADEHSEHRRAFCEKHSHRGDCGLEDSDVNYELIDGEGGKVIAPEDISPSGFGGVIDCT